MALLRYDPLATLPQPPPVIKEEKKPVKQALRPFIEWVDSYGMIPKQGEIPINEFANGQTKRLYNQSQVEPLPTEEPERGKRLMLGIMQERGAVIPNQPKAEPKVEIVPEIKIDPPAAITVVSVVPVVQKPKRKSVDWREFFNTKIKANNEARR